MMRELERQKCDDVHSFRHNVGTGQTDGETELLKHYRDVHPLHADARQNHRTRRR